MEYSYKRILNDILSEVPINKSDYVYAIAFIAGPGFGKSTISKILSKKLNIQVVENDQIRRKVDNLGFESFRYSEDIKKMAFDRTVYLLENKTSHILDANIMFHWQKAVESYNKYNAKLYFIELKCNEEEVIKRIKLREQNFGKDDNQSRATIEDYNRYLQLKENINIPDELVFYTINTDTSLDEIEKQVDLVVDKIKRN